MKLEWNLWIDNYKGLKIEGIDGEEPAVTLNEGELTASQHAAMHLVVEIARCLLLGKSIDHTFNPNKPHLVDDVKEPIVRCKWMKSGKLIMLGESTKRWQHAENVEQATMRKRVFTCTRDIYEATPKRRPSTKRKVKHEPSKQESS